MNLIDHISTIYREKFGHTPAHIARAPGRVNLLGEHVDYNDGFVLPAAIDRATYVAFSPTNARHSTLVAADFDQQASFSPESISTKTQPDSSPLPEWGLYPAGVMWSLMEESLPVLSMNAVFASDVPRGSGLSSSASVEMAFMIAWQTLGGWTLRPMQRALLGQKAENKYVGVNCGIMDQFASMFGRKGFVMKLDCRSMEFEYVPFTADGLSILMLNTNVKHSLASTAYNARRQECAQGLAWIQEAYPDVMSLRDASEKMLDEMVSSRDATIDKRCRFVVQEISRLQAACNDLVKGDMMALGRKMYDTHNGLRNMYEVSCRELDFLVEAVADHPGVLGARMMGGGFGGCTINLVKQEDVDELISSLSNKYHEAMELPLTAFTVQIENGTEKIR